MAREEGSGNVRASGGAAVAAAVAAAAAAANADAMASAAVVAENASAAADATANAEAKNAAALVAPAAGEDVTLARDEVEGDGTHVAVGEGAGAIQGGIGSRQGSVAGEGVEIPIPAVEQTQGDSLRVTTIIEQLAVAPPMIQGLADQVNAL